MSKKLCANITCPQCAHVFPMQLYRSIWVEHPENRALILNDEINVMTCPKCRFHERLEFPFLCTNVKRGFALWYEPYHDPDIDEDIAHYKKMMGPNSFYAKAPRIPVWSDFKKKLIEIGATESAEMQKNANSLVHHVEERKRLEEGAPIKKRIRKNPWESRTMNEAQKTNSVTEHEVIFRGFTVGNGYLWLC